MATFFHVTDKTNLNAILRDGLIPAIGERSRDLGETKAAIYTFPSRDTLESAMLNWLGEWYTEKEEETGLPIELVYLELAPHESPIIDPRVPFEALFFETIPVDRITQIFDERWRSICTDRSRMPAP